LARVRLARMAQDMDNVTTVVVALALLGLLLFFVLGRGKKALPPADERKPELPGKQVELPPAKPKGASDQTPARAPSAEPSRELAVEAEKAPEPETAASVPSSPAEPQRAEAATAAEPAPARDTDRDVAALKKGLANTRGGFIARLAKLFGARPSIDSSLLEEIEEVLITADLGVKTSNRILEHLREQMRVGALKDEEAVWASLRALAADILKVPAPAITLQNKPALILVVGVNGAGKTTTIGKLAARYVAEGKKVLLAAGDTFRAAAVLQLEVWGKRVDCPVVKGKEGGDPGAVMFEAVKKAQNEGFDLVIADTAGRLHTKAPLMEELKKVDRTIQKALGGRGADEILLVLDATTGQNAVQQMHMFREALQVNGVVLTKLDGTAKGGMILGIVDEHKVPVRFIGLGERVEDLREFDADSFVEAMFTKPDGETLAA
jgi:fused signal recognition particle receptor